ncbi:unnamed protein product [Sphagnum tenellum]
MRYLETLSSSSTEYQKNLNWLRHALNFPYNKMVKIPVSIKTSSFKDVSNYVSSVYKKLDSYIFGMPDVKEELLTFVAKRISNPNSTDHVLALQGSNGVGKCFAANTEILLHNGDKKLVQDIVVGDILMGDDSKERKVLALGTGFDDLYKITHLNTGDTYTVNKDHILCLKNNSDSPTIEMSVEKYLSLSSSERCLLKGYVSAVKYKRQPVRNPYYMGLSLAKTNIEKIPSEYMINSRQYRLILLEGILDAIGKKVQDGQYARTSGQYEMFHESETLRLDIRELCASLGFRTTNIGKNGVFLDTEFDTCSSLQIECVGKGNYYGFTLDGNERFLLGNYIVTHNTRLAHGLAKALDLPIKTINLGSVNDVSYFTGHGFTYVDSEPGRIVQILNETQCKNCIIYFDELDKIHKTDKGQSIYAFLTHLIDPTQNTKYQDVYLSGLELDVSNVFFVFSYNDEEQIDATVKDRLKIIRIKDPKNEDKVDIAEQFIIPEICENVNYNVKINRETIEQIVSQDKSRSGLRGIRRVLEDIIAKMNVIRLLDETIAEKLSFYDSSQDNMIGKIIKHHKYDDDSNYKHMYS